MLGYYDPFLAMANHAVEEGFLRPAHREMMLAAPEPEELLRLLANYDPPQVTKWLDRQTR